MAYEIERKFLIDPTHPTIKHLLSTTGSVIAQGYLSNHKDRVVRVRTRDEKGYLTIKGSGTGITKPEYEYEIPLDDAQMMLATLCTSVLYKTRYLLPITDTLTFEIDVFRDCDLILAELELPDEATPYPPQDWIVQEVSEDHAYSNTMILERIVQDAQRTQTTCVNNA